MKNYILVAMAFVTSTSAYAFSQQEDKFLDEVAEAYVISAACPTLAIETSGLSFALTMMRMDGQVAVTEIERRAAEDKWQIGKKRSDMACVIGEMYYGKNGTKKRGLLHRR